MGSESYKISIHQKSADLQLMRPKLISLSPVMLLIVDLIGGLQNLDVRMERLRRKALLAVFKRTARVYKATLIIIQFFANGGERRR